MTEETNPCYVCGDRPAAEISGRCVHCAATTAAGRVGMTATPDRRLGRGLDALIPSRPKSLPRHFELAWVAHFGSPPADADQRALFGLLREFWEAGAAQASADDPELRELLRVSQHHVDRSWPECQLFLGRAYEVLGQDFAMSGDPGHVAPLPTPTETPDRD